ADIEEAYTGDQGRVRHWLAQALKAPRDPAWVAGGFKRLHAGRRFRLGAGLGEFLRVEGCLGEDEKGFDVVRALPFQP
ncbi:hypothetical protein ACC686_37010, partial [Rhizobium johnstonii]|uniref:hypothetical protein n=1 Tax=Rhizobium johnstonii TaxID=3019933 RepID=UPI003F9703F6